MLVFNVSREISRIVIGLSRREARTTRWSRGGGTAEYRRRQECHLTCHGQTRPLISSWSSSSRRVWLCRTWWYYPVRTRSGLPTASSSSAASITTRARGSPTPRWTRGSLSPWSCLALTMEGTPILWRHSTWRLRSRSTTLITGTWRLSWACCRLIRLCLWTLGPGRSCRTWGRTSRGSFRLLQWLWRRWVRLGWRGGKSTGRRGETAVCTCDFPGLPLIDTAVGVIMLAEARLMYLEISCDLKGSYVVRWLLITSTGDLGRTLSGCSCFWPFYFWQWFFKCRWGESLRGVGASICNFI